MTMVKSRTIFFGLALVPFALLAAEPSSQEFKDQLAFDYADSGNDLPGWELTPGTVATRDREQAYSGTASARIDHEPSNPNTFTSVMELIDRQYVGERIELRGYLRTANVEGWSGLWLGLNHMQESVEYTNMAPHELNGTNDWQPFSIGVPLNDRATQIRFGVIVYGSGTIWADDLELLVDGIPIWDAPQVTGPIDTDTEFDSGSGIVFDALDKQQVENLALLGRVWGFLKYHHPAVTGGQHHWDYELFRVMGPILQATQPEDSRQVMLDWIERLGPVVACDDCAPDPQRTHLLPRLDWLKDEALLGPELSDLLLSIHRNRRNTTDHYFVRPNGGIGNPVFAREPSYDKQALPDAGFRQLAVFRFWNVVEYWFPYRNLIDAEWDGVLPEFIHRMSEVTTVEEYHRALTLLIATVSDTHAQWNVTRSLPPSGECRLPHALRFADGKFVVWANGARGGALEGGLRVGDVVLSIDNQSLAGMAEDLSAYYPASNRAAQRRNMGVRFTRGICGSVDVFVQRGEHRLTITEERVPQEEIDHSRMYQHVRAGSVYQSLSADVAYIKLPGIKSSQIPDYLKRLDGTKGLIIDIRGYPSDFVVFKLGNHLAKQTTPFVRFTQADMQNPGAFAWSGALELSPQAPLYEGKVVVLVDEWTQSSAEYTAMAFRAAGAVVVGSTTAGADGNFSPLVIPGGVSGGLTGLGVFYPDQRQTQRVGIIPDISAQPTVSGIRAGRDEVLEAGLRALDIDGLNGRTLRAIATRPSEDPAIQPVN